MHFVYHRSVLLDPARKHGFGNADGHDIPDLQLLAKLQRFGAATGFLDFWRDPLVALWYACEENDRDGRIFALDLGGETSFRGISFEEAVQSTEEIFRRSGMPDKNLYIEKPVHEKKSAEEIRMNEVSVQAWPLIPEDAVTSIVIRASDKPLIRRELESFLDFDRPALFADVLQFSALNNEKLPLPHFEDPEFSLVLGNQCFMQRDFTGAIAHYDKCIELAPDVDIGYFHFVRGNAKAEDGDLRGAREDYDLGLRCEERLARELSRKSACAANRVRRRQLHFNRGNIKSELEDLEGALEDYKKSISIGNQDGVRDPFYFLNRGNTNLLLNRYSDAMHDYDEALKAGSLYASFNKANVLVTLGRFDEAIQCYDSAIREGDDRFGVICNRNGVAAILNRLGGDGYVVGSPRFKDVTRRLIVEVSLRADANNRYTEFFNFHGTIGNYGNTGGEGLPGGKGYKGKVGFVVVVKGEEW